MRLILLFMLALPTLLPFPSYAAQSTQTVDCREALDSYSLLSDEELERLAEKIGDPYAGGTVTMEDVNWMREYRDITGRVYEAGDLAVLKQAHECRSSGSPDGNSQSPGASSSSLSIAERQTADRACEELAMSEGLSVDLGYTAADIEILTGCRQDQGGGWFFPTGQGDPRLGREWPLTRNEAAQIDELRMVLDRQLRELASIFDATIDPTVPYNANDPRTLTEGMDRLRQDLYPGAASLGESRGLEPYYEAILLDYIQDPTHIALARYVAWWRASRQATTPVNLCVKLNPMACPAYIEAMGFEREPWPWELGNELTMATYLDWALANGFVPSTSLIRS